MLQALRDKTSGLIAKIVLGALIFVFSFFGIESYFTGRNETWVAKVGDHEIRSEDFRQGFDKYRQRVTNMMGGQVDGAMFERPEIKLQVLNGLIDEQLLLEANKNLGVVIHDERVRKIIREAPQFQDGGKFSQVSYSSFLASQRKSAAGIEDELRKDLAVQELPSMIAGSGIVTAVDIDSHIKLRDQTRDLRTLTLPKPSVTESASDADVEAYFKSHSAEFMTPEQVSLDYVEIDASTLKIDTTPDDTVLRERYEREKSRYLTPEQRLVSHILVAAKGGDADAQKAALAKAQELAKSVRDGKDFATVAKQSSEDLGSKSQGGDLGWLEKGVADPAFESALFAMKKGDISEPVLSAEGYHVIQLRDVREKKEKPFEEVKAELAKAHLETARDTQFNDLATKLTDASFADPAALDSTAKAVGGSVQKTALFSRQGGTGIAANPAVIKAAFSDAVLIENNNSDVIDVSPEKKVVVRLSEHKRSEPMTLDSVREDIRTRLAKQAASKKAREQADALLARLRNGETLEKLAGELKISVNTLKGTGRNAANVDSRIAVEAFKLPRPKADKAEYGQVELLDDAYAVFALDAVTDGDISKVDDAGRDAVRSQLQNAYAAVATRAFVESLRKTTKIQIAQDRLQ